MAAVGLGVSATLTWLLRVVSTRIQRRFRDKVTIALERHVAGLQAQVVTVAHQERPDYLDRLSVLRDQIFVLDHMYMSVFSTAGWILRLVVTVVLLMSIHWSLALLVLFALPTVATSGWRPGVERRVQEESAQHSRRAQHFYRLATTAPSARELRVLGMGARVARDRRAEWESWYAPTSRARWVSAGGTPSAGRSSAWGTSRRSSTSPWGSTPRRRRSSWCSPRVGGSRVRRSDGRARSASCAGSGSTGRAGSPGWRTTRPPSDPATSSRRTGSPEGIRVRRGVVRLSGQRPAGPARRRPRCCPPAPWSPSSGRTAPASPPW